MNDDRDPIDRETGIQGPRWHTVHDGYFASRDVARPFIEAVRRAAIEGPPDTIADLGGGTGFVLRELSAGLAPGVRLVNVDLSAKQLAEADAPRVQRLRLAADRVTRRDLGVGDGRLLIIMRSLLHYAGSEGLRPLLAHLARQLVPGEALVHQSACFAREEDARCLNLLYQRMRTEKWYPTVRQLQAELQAAGLAVREVAPAPPLVLTSADLAERYGLAPREVEAIREELANRFGTAAGVFEPGADGFTAWLHYHIFVCRRAA